MNKLPLEKRVQILSMLVEGSSMRSAARVADVSFNSVARVLVEAGTVAMDFHDRTVRGLKTANLQCDEIWAFCYAKKRTVRAMPEEKFRAGIGDIWTFTALDRDSKLIVSWFAGNRDTACAKAFLQDTTSRIVSPVQITTDAWPGYRELISETFPLDASYGQVRKVFSETPDKGPSRKYSPGLCVGADRRTIFGNTDHNKISTSHVERQNLNMRMGMRRFTRLTNAFSKKFDNHCYALALYFYHYNFCRIHKTLRVTPAMQAGIADTAMSMEDLCAMMEVANPPKKRGPYKQKMAEA